MPFFGFCLAYALYRLARRKPSLVVDEEGIFDNASALGAGMIRWEEIREMYTFVFRGQTTIGMALTDEDAVLARQNPLKRGLMSVNRGLAGSVVNIPQSVLPMPAEELLREIGRRLGEEPRG